MECIMLSGQENNGSGNNLRNSRKGLFIFAGVFLIIILVVLGGYSIWNRYFSVAARQYRESKQAYEGYLDIYRKDTYGGKTPQETLDMFVSALEKGDIELASKYFMPDDSGGREKWVNLLADIKSKGNLDRFAKDIRNYDESKSSFEPYYLFIYKNNDGTIALQITMIFNSISKVWKIESL